MSTSGPGPGPCDTDEWSESARPGPYFRTRARERQFEVAEADTGWKVGLAGRAARIRMPGRIGGQIL
jgi:hypothetical protein